MWIRVCDNLPEGEMLSFDHGEKKILLANMSGVLHAADRTCTHSDADLSSGFLSPQGVRCPLHLSVFDLDTGAPLNPPAEAPLRLYISEKREDGIYVDL